MPNTPNGATKIELEEGVFVIVHPDGSRNLVGNVDGAHLHSNSTTYDGHGQHFNEQASFTSEEGIAVHNNNVGNLDSEFNYQHLGDHTRTSYDDGSRFQSHMNITGEGMNSVFIIHPEGSGAEVSHYNVHFEDYFFG